MKTPFYLFFFSFFCMALLSGIINAMQNEQQQQLDRQLFTAVGAGKVRKVEELIRTGANVNARNEMGETTLHWAANSPGEQYTNIIGVLLANRAAVNVQDNDGRTPLHYAASRGDQNRVYLLLNKGANGLLPDNSGMTAMDEARNDGYNKIAELILYMTVAQRQAQRVDQPEVTPEPVIRTD
jgi:ankyrin repeat protein